LQKSAKQKPIDTRQELAKVAGVSHDTIAKVEKIQAKATPEIKSAIKAGKQRTHSPFKMTSKRTRSFASF
jgi:DNA-binding XRE family transcriptional regulator